MGGGRGGSDFVAYEDMQCFALIYYYYSASSDD